MRHLAGPGDGPAVRVVKGMANFTLHHPARVLFQDRLQAIRAQVFFNLRKPDPGFSQGQTLQGLFFNSSTTLPGTERFPENIRTARSGDGLRAFGSFTFGSGPGMDIWWHWHRGNRYNLRDNNRRLNSPRPSAHGQAHAERAEYDLTQPSPV